MRKENKELRPIVIQGAMDIEIEYLIKNLSNTEKIVIGDFSFFKGEIYSYPVIISKTEIGTMNCAIATTTAIIKFNPIAIINQGIAGGHTKLIHNGDIIVGEQCTNINDFSMPVKEAGQGSNPFEWEYNHDINLICADKKLLEIAKSINYSNGNLYFGIIGSGDVFNREVDRINWIHEKKNTLCEEMESIGTYSASMKFNISCIGIRAISNNELTREEYDRTIAIKAQEFTLEVIKEYINS